MKKNLLLVVLFFVSFFMAKADEGMWLPQLLETLNEKRMKSLGMKITAADIYSVNKGSLKDAVVSFGGFCTGEVVSNQGLVLTNHHCGFDAIQNHSTLDNNYIRDGFWAMNKSQELPNQGLFVTFIVRIEDVSKQVMEGVSGNIEEHQRQSIIDKNINEVVKIVKKEAYQGAFVRNFFEGNKYYLFVTETYNDVRLVGAPPSSIGNFGKDTDNWMWPRHTGDFSVFRIYAGKDNKPAAYSPSNVPYVPKKALSVSLNGIKENDFTMVFGFPGRTTEYLPSEAVEQIMTVNDPAKIMVRDKALAILNRYMRADEAIKIQYSSKYAGIANAWKKWQGEVLGLTRTGGVEKKKQYETVFLKRVNDNAALKARYDNVLPNLINAYKEIKPYGLARDYYLETTSKVEMISIVNRVMALREAQRRNDYNEQLQKHINLLSDFLKEYNSMVDEDMFAAMLEIYIEKQEPAYIAPYAKEQATLYKKDYKKWVGDLYKKSIFANGEKVLSELKTNPSVLYNLLETDEAAKLIGSINAFFYEAVAPKLNATQQKINNLQRIYMQAQMEVFTEKTFYPDANSTLRVAYGKVDGYKPADGTMYKYSTYLDGVMEKYVPGDYEFDVPQRLRDLYKNKNYGQYGVNGKMPVCFIASNHTTGGNSGSPALNANGNLIGINFDRVWQGTMSDINYDPSICRNIMVDIRYVLFIIDKYAGAGHLVKEMKLVKN